MDALAILGIVYGAGAVASLVGHGAAGTFDHDLTPLFVAAVASAVWPLVGPYYVGRGLRVLFAARHDRRLRIAEEKRKWLESPLP